MNKNPIFIEYNSHERCDCYKILNPWTKYREDKHVLCRVDQGFAYATVLAIGVMNQCLADALKMELEKSNET